MWDYACKVCTCIYMWGVVRLWFVVCGVCICMWGVGGSSGMCVYTPLLALGGVNVNM